MPKESIFEKMAGAASSFFDKAEVIAESRIPIMNGRHSLYARLKKNSNGREYVSLEAGEGILTTAVPLDRESAKLLLCFLQQQQQHWDAEAK